MATVFKLRGAIKTYEWGKYGLQSMVSVLHSSAHKDYKVDEDLPYAELWLGTHESGPATIPCFNGKKLLNWLMENPQTLGDITQEFGSSIGLPFLFKVLSVNKALSVQAHPDKNDAAKLHRKFPQHYPDENHKPELAIALTNFKALCGFRLISEFKSFLREIKELQKVIGLELTNVFLNSDAKSDLRPIFSAVMTSPTDIFQPLLLQIVNNFKLNKYTSNLCLSIKDVFIKTSEQYPDDIGSFCFFFLNYVNLKKGEAIFLAANEPHAYLYGDCIECMACSDNVVRAGLTPKYRDVQTLCDMLTYNCKSGEENIFPPINDPNDPFLKTFAPPVKEFAIDSISLPSGDKIYNLKVLQSASILLIVEGSGVCHFDNEELDFDSGTSLFISSNTCIKIKTTSSVLMFRAYCRV